MKIEDGKLLSDTGDVIATGPDKLLTMFKEAAEMDTYTCEACGHDHAAFRCSNCGTEFSKKSSE